MARMLFAIFAFLPLVVLPCVLATLASPFPVVHVQPDGQEIKVFVRGNEHFSWEEDENEYTVVPVREDDGKAKYVYAALDRKHDIIPSRLEVGKCSPMQRMGTRQRVHERSRAYTRSQKQRRSHFQARQTTSQRTGTIKNLVVMVRFADQASRTLPTTDDIMTIFNNVGPHPLCPHGSVRDVWAANSYGQLNIESIATGWVDVDVTEMEASCGVSGRCASLHTALAGALAIAESYVNLTDFDRDDDGWIDMITFIHSGYAAEWGGLDEYEQFSQYRIWSHQGHLTDTYTSPNHGVSVSLYHVSSAFWRTFGTEVAHIGVIAHEAGHFLGLPDLYDTDHNGRGAGNWDLMANSWGWDNTQTMPPHLSAWSRMQLGYASVVDITSSGVYDVPAAESSATVYRIATGFPTGEYLLIENRQNIAFDQGIPAGGAGLMIYHVDEAAVESQQSCPTCTTGSWPRDHYRVAVVQADGAFDLERNRNPGDIGDSWKVGGQTELSSSTSPSTKSYQYGNLFDTGITITVLSPSAATMQIRVEFAGFQTTCGAFGPAIACTDNDVLLSSASCNSASSCNATTCCAPFCSVPSNLNAACNDNSDVTINDVCTSEGRCEGIPATCSNMGVSCPADFARNDATPCTPGTTCNSQTCCVSFCSVPSNLGKTCNDNNPATFNDVCVAGGSCQGTQATCSNQNVQCPSGFAYPSSVPACTPGVNCNAATCCVAQPTLRVSSLVIKYITNAQGRYIYQATATVVNQSNGVMGNVKVTGNFRIGGATLTAQTANSNTSGVTVINTTNTWARLNQKDPRATFCVTNLVLSGYTYTPGSYCATVL